MPLRCLSSAAVSCKCMKRAFLLASLCITIVSVESQPLREVRLYYDRETQLRAHYYIQGNDSSQIQGLYTTYRPDGSCLSEVYFKHGLKDGSFITYHSNGEVAAVLHYQSGLKEGSAKVFYPDGTVRQISSFSKDLLEGEVKVYYSSGKLQRLAYFEANIPERAIRSYYENGQLHKEIPQFRGKTHGSLHTYYKDGQLKSEEEFFDGRLSGRAVRYYPGGQLKEELHYVDGLQEGLMRRYHLNGQLAYEGYFQEGVAEDILTSYSTDSQLLQKTSQVGLNQRRSMRYHADGTVASEYFFSKHEDKHTQIRYDSASNRLSVRHYKANLPEGKWETYDPSSGIRIQEKYKDGILQQRKTYQKERLSSEEIFHAEQGRHKKSYYYDNGKLWHSTQYIRGVKDGSYVLSHRSGKPKAIGHYRYGYPTGTWKYYDSEGQLIKTKKYEVKKKNK